ncbi:MAG: hypothetical protein J6A54_03730 [Clostridia bacterium]|nr:hypothetical protein [Clostridia bacterium]
MGFGIMLVGCFFLLLGAFTTLAPFTYVLGSAIVLYSLKELIKQNKLFLCSMILYAIQFILSMIYMFVYVFGASQAAINTLSTALQLSNLIISIVLLTSIYLLARAVELQKLQTKIILSYIFAVIYFVCIVLANTVFKASEFAMTRISVIVFIAQLIYVVLTILIVANSYMRICYEDDVNMDKKTGNVPLDFLNEKLNYAMTPREKKDLEKKDKGEKK